MVGGQTLILEVLQLYTSYYWKDSDFQHYLYLYGLGIWWGKKPAVLSSVLCVSVAQPAAAEKSALLPYGRTTECSMPFTNLPALVS